MTEVDQSLLVNIVKIVNIYAMYKYMLCMNQIVTEVIYYNDVCLHRIVCVYIVAMEQHDSTPYYYFLYFRHLIITA